jgi:hypothetical protein
MSTEKFANNAQTTLASDLSSSSTTLMVVDPSTFPLTPQFRIRIDDELLLVTNVSSGTWMVERGKEGTSAVSHAAGATVVQLLTAGVMTDLVNSSAPVSSIISCIQQFRLSLEAGVPYSISEQIAKSTIYLVPYAGMQIAIYDGESDWLLVASSGASLSLSGLTGGKVYDVFAYLNSGSILLELSAAWTDGTTRTDQIEIKDGAWVKTSSPTKRWVGTLRATGTSTTELSWSKLFVWNTDNQLPMKLRRRESTSSWTYNSATVRQATGVSNNPNQIEIVTGNVALVEIQVSCQISSASSNAGLVGIGIGSSVTPSQDLYSNPAPSLNSGANALLIVPKGKGYQYYTWLEWCSNSTGAVTFYSDNLRSGMIGQVMA